MLKNKKINISPNYCLKSLGYEIPITSSFKESSFFLRNKQINQTKATPVAPVDCVDSNADSVAAHNWKKSLQQHI